MTRVLVTGSRDWTRAEAVEQALDQALEQMGDFTLVSGHCPTGADAMAEQWARRNQVAVETHPANWDLYGKAAGYLRNKAMVEMGADVCLAFVRNNSPGASMTVRLARRAGIRVIERRQSE